MTDDLIVWLRAQLDEDEMSVISGECRCGDGPRRSDCPDRIVAEVEALPYADRPGYREEWAPNG